MSGEPAVHGNLVVTNLEMTALLGAGTVLVMDTGVGNAGHADALQSWSVVVVSVRKRTFSGLVLWLMMMVWRILVMMRRMVLRHRVMILRHRVWMVVGRLLSCLG